MDYSTPVLKEEIKRFISDSLVVLITNNAISDDEFNYWSEEIESIDNMTDIEFRAWFSTIAEMR